MSLPLNRKMKSRAIAAQLKQQIRNRKLPPGTPLPSARDLAGHYHVCMMTANRALDLLEEQSLIIRRKGSGNYVAKNIYRGTRLMLGVADMTEHSSAYARQIHIDVFPETAIRCLKEENCEVRPISYADFRLCDGTVLEGLHGLLLSANFINEETEDFIRSLKLPVVIYRSEFELNFPCPQVIPDHSVAMNKLFSLARLESFNGIIVLCQPHPNGRARAEAFEHYAVEYGFQPGQILRIELNQLEIRPKILPLVRQIPGKLVISCSDLMTCEIIQLFSEKELVCGRDYQLVSYDNLSKIMPMPPGIPEITSIDYSRTSAAKTAAKQLIRSALNPRSVSYQTIKFPTRLIIRESAFRSRKELISL